MLLRARAPAKVNLTLHVLGRRPDGFHELDSLVAFAGCAADALTLEPGRALGLGRVDGPFSGAVTGEGDQNLVLRAARAAAERIEGLRLGVFGLTKRIPVAAGLGGGSADAGAALRLIAEANGLAADDPRLRQAAAATGSDVPACLLSRACRMSGRGETVEPLGLPPLAAVLANPLKAVSTAQVFGALGLSPGAASLEDKAGEGPAAAPASPSSPDELLSRVRHGRNDLEAPAITLLPEIAAGLESLARAEGCRVARMSGSGATAFGLFGDLGTAKRAARALAPRLPDWWIRVTLLG